MPAPRLPPGPAARPADCAGFTLAEMLAALAILMVGVTTLLAALSDSVSQRRSTEMRLLAAQAVEDVVLRAREGIRRSDGAATDLDVELAAAAEPVAPGLRLQVETIEEPSRPDVWLLRITARWMEEGDFVAEEFLRLVPRQLPLGVRVARFREENGGAGTLPR